MSKLVDRYMNHKINHLLNCAKIITFENEFLRSCFSIYFNIYINSYYYHIFETVDENTCNFDTIKEEFDGKEIEMLESLANYELEQSNEEYSFKKSYISGSKNISLFLVKLDLNNFFEGEEFNLKINSYIDSYPNINKMLGSNRARLIDTILKNNKLISKFFNRKEDFYKLKCLLFNGENDLVNIKLDYNIVELKNNFKSSLIRRVYLSDKLDSKRLELLASKFVKKMLFDDYLAKDFYKAYFIGIPSSLFSKMDELEEVLNILNNPFINRYLVIGLKHDDYVSHVSLFDSFPFRLACIYDFSVEDDVNFKLNELDVNYKYSYILVDGYRIDDYDLLCKYSFINVSEVLFMKE